MACLICFHFKEAKLCSSWDKWSLGWWKNLKYKDWYNGAIEFSLSIPSLLLAAGADQLGLFGSRVSHVCQHLWTNGLCVHYCQRSDWMYATESSWPLLQNNAVEEIWGPKTKRVLNTRRERSHHITNWFQLGKPHILNESCMSSTRQNQKSMWKPKHPRNGPLLLQWPLFPRLSVDLLSCLTNTCLMACYQHSK